MTMDEIKALIDAMAASDLAEMELSRDGWTLRLSRRAFDDGGNVDLRHAEERPEAGSRSPPARSRSVAPPPTDWSAVRAPLFGTVHLGPSPGAPPFVGVGQTVEAGALLCTVEAMKTFNEVRAARAGAVEAVLVETGQEVEAGQPLLRLA